MPLLLRYNNYSVHSHITTCVVGRYSLRTAICWIPYYYFRVFPCIFPFQAFPPSAAKSSCRYWYGDMGDLGNGWCKPSPGRRREQPDREAVSSEETVKHSPGLGGKVPFSISTIEEGHRCGSLFYSPGTLSQPWQIFSELGYGYEYVVSYCKQLIVTISIFLENVSTSSIRYIIVLVY